MLTYLFPGQGSQNVGMGKALYDTFDAARAVFEEADDALSMKLSELCFAGTEDELRRTEITQPAILTTSIAALRALEAERPDLQPNFAAGHSLGEWSALVAVGALTFADAVRLVHTRGRLMQEAVPEGEGAMAACLGLDPAQVEAVCAEVSKTAGVVVPANYNSPEQTVISGTAAAVAAAGLALTEAGAKRVVPLEVSAPFHSPLMKPAADGLAQALEGITVGPMRAPVVTNVEATPNSDPERVKALLVEQVTAPVRWVQSVQRLVADGGDQGLELGPNKVLKGLIRRIDRGLTVAAVGDPAELAKALSGLAIAS